MPRVYVFFVFFKQKTAYEMRISDWSSDVCSSDLHQRPDTCPDIPPAVERLPTHHGAGCDRDRERRFGRRDARDRLAGEAATDRKSVVQGKSASVGVDLGCRRSIKNTNATSHR